MSTTHNETEPTTAGATTGERAAVPTPRAAQDAAGAPGPSRRRLTVVLAVGLVAVLATGIGVAVKLTQPKHAVASAVTLPGTVGTLGPITAASDPLKSDRFQARVKDAVGTAPYAAQMYGTANNQRTIRVVAARTDLTKKLDEVMAVDAGTQSDGVSCTQNVQLVPNGKSAVRPTVMFCWKNSPTLSVYTLIIDPRSPQVSTADGVASVKQVWDFVR